MVDEDYRRRLVHVRVTKNSKGYTAQCLEFDISGEGESPVEALDHFRVVTMGQIMIDKDHGKEPLADVPCAPFSDWYGIERDSLVGIYLDDIFNTPAIREYKADG